MSKWTNEEPELLVEKEDKENEEEVVDLFEVTAVFKVKATSADDAESDIKWIIDEGIIKVSDEGHEPIRSYDVISSEPSEVY